MDGNRLIGTVILAAALAAAQPGGTAAQSSDPGLEGLRWDLTSYLDGAEVVSVPWDVEATLRLDDGTASGSGGCSPFTGTYQLDDETLVFGEPTASTLVDCDETREAIEDAFLPALSSVAAWSLDDVTLSLLDETGATVLELQQQTIGLTPRDVAALMATIDELRSEADRSEARAQTIQRLRNRVATLEATVERLRSRETGPQPTPGPNAAERVLLEAIPPSIARTCVPRRDELPAGTVAAVQCRPRSAIVRDMAYYLMESDDASAVLSQRIRDNIGRNWKGNCTDGKPGVIVDTPGPDAFACYRNDDRRANLRVVSGATTCRQLQAGETRLKEPAIYAAVLGEDSNIGKLTRWAGGKNPGHQDIIRRIDRPNERWSNMCPR
jgi:heat shock protein HslJ